MSVPRGISRRHGPPALIYEAYGSGVHDIE